MNQVGKLPDGFPIQPITIIVGHYGVGKTNLSLNLAIDIAATGKHVTLVDLDVVNPYFRSSEHGALLAAEGVQLINPVFAGSTLDVPSLSGEIYTALGAADEDHIVLVDAGGDDVGATALGRFADIIAKHSYSMLYVVNAYRNVTQTAKAAAEILSELEAKAGLCATSVVNNSHLQGETTLTHITDALSFAQETAELVQLPLVCTTMPLPLAERLRDMPGSSAKAAAGAYANPTDSPLTCTEPRTSVLSSTLGLQTIYIVQIYVGTPWE